MKTITLLKKYIFVVFSVYIPAVYLNVLVVKTIHTMKAQKEATLVGLCKSSEISGGQCCVEKYLDTPDW